MAPPRGIRVRSPLALALWSLFAVIAAAWGVSGTAVVVTGVPQLVSAGPYAPASVRFGPSAGAAWSLLTLHAMDAPIAAKAAYPTGELETAAGRSVGFLGLVSAGEQIAATMNATRAASVLAMGVEGTALDPIPGGCCTTCDRDFDPSVTVTYKNSIATISFGSANVGYANGTTPPLCKLDRRLVYDLYEYVLADTSLSESELYGGIAKMSIAAGMREHGKKVHSFVGTDAKRADVPIIVGRGIVYNVLVKDTERGTESAYAGGFTYACDLDDKSSCGRLGSTTTLALAVVAGGVGIVLVFFGHCLFRFQIYLSAVGIFSIAMFILAGNTALSDKSLGVRVGVSAIVGLACGPLPFLLWHLVSLALALLFPALCIGFLIMCFIFSSALGELKLWENGLNFGMTFAAGVALPACFVVAYPRLTSIMFGALCGAYAFMGAVNYSVRTSFTDVVMAVIDRATVKEYAVIYTGIPYNTNEYLMLAFWLVLAFLGMLVQHYVTAKHTVIPAGPLAPLRVRATLREGVARARSLRRLSVDAERRPLLASAGDESDMDGYEHGHHINYYDDD